MSPRTPSSPTFPTGCLLPARPPAEASPSANVDDEAIEGSANQASIIINHRHHYRASRETLSFTRKLSNAVITQRNMSPMAASISRPGEAPPSTAYPRRPSRDPPYGSPARSTCTCVVVVVVVVVGAGEVLPRKAERKPGCGERPPWPVGPSQTVRRTGRCRGRSPSCCRRRQLRHRRRQLPHHLRPCTASRRPHAPTDLGNPGCTEKMRKTRGLSYRTRRAGRVRLSVL